MANILDYLDWRGDLPFSASPFNEADALILAELSYFPAEGIVPRDINDTVTIAELDERFDSENVPPEVRIISFSDDVTLVHKLAESRRFDGMKLTGYVNMVDPSRDLQFAAMTCIFDNFTYVAFRGTDSSLAGWKEDLNFSFMPQTASQSMAVQYITENFADSDEVLVLGGHSKGGNLAIYAAANCPDAVRSRIRAIFAFDSPGFKEDIAASEEYLAVTDKVISVIPQSSLVGQLLSCGTENRIVKSSASGISQHLAFTWQVTRSGLEYAEELSKTGVFVNKTMTGWISSLDETERQGFVEAVFTVLESAQRETFNELQNNKRKSFTAILKALKHLSPEQQAIAKKALSQLASYGKRAFLAGLEENLAERELPRLPNPAESAGKLLTTFKKSEQHKDDISNVRKAET